MRNRVLTSILVSFLAVGVLSPTFANPKGVPNSNAAGYWTEERKKNAIPREFLFEVGATEGKLASQAKRGSSGGSNTFPTGTTTKWTDLTTNEAKVVGKVFFTMAGVDYVCSGSLVKDDSLTLDLVVTAGHCVWNNSKVPNQRGFASNWTFFPNFASTGKTDGISARALVANINFTNQTSFNTTATLFDYAFAVLDQSNSNTTIADSDRPTVTISDSGYPTPMGNAFGYPAVGFSGTEMYWSRGTISTDPNNGGRTWRIPSNMTGGASGGPWYDDGYTSTGSARNVSVNSYKYSSDSKGMYGPKFNQSTLDLLDQAKKGNCTGVPITISCKQF